VALFAAVSQRVCRFRVTWGSESTGLLIFSTKLLFGSNLIYRKTNSDDSMRGAYLAQPSQLRTIFGVSAISFAVKSRVSIAKL
jgi:hypothetical protein